MKIPQKFQIKNMIFLKKEILELRKKYIIFKKSKKFSLKSK